jgi:hypothetical protein
MTVIRTANITATGGRLVAILHLHAGTSEADVEALVGHVHHHLEINGVDASVAAQLADRVLDVEVTHPSESPLHALHWLADQLAWAMATAPEVAK